MGVELLVCLGGRKGWSYWYIEMYVRVGVRGCKGGVYRSLSFLTL